MQEVKLQWHSAFTSALRIELEEEITITLVSHYYPRKLMEHLEKVWHMQIMKNGKGIYYLTGAVFPIQLLVVRELSEIDNFWLKSIRNDYKEKEEFMEVLERYERKKDSIYYQAVMDIILRANRNVIEEERNIMCDALRELYEEWFADELEERRRKAVAEGIEQGIERGEELGLLALIAKKLKKQKTPAQIAEDLEEEVSVIERICNVMKDFAPDYDTTLVYQKLQKM
ncbi:MAG: hypothetical protein SPJ92_06110 [Bariatricus sp.]|nr:hypothetical protein [Bariatricus sp.]